MGNATTTGRAVRLRRGAYLFVLAALVACGGGDDDDNGGGAGTGGGDRGSGADDGASGGGSDQGSGSGVGSDTGSSTGECGDDGSTSLLEPDVDRLIITMDLDDTHLYYSQSSGELDLNGFYRVPLAGGDPERIADTSLLVGGGPVMVDGDMLYYGDNTLSRTAKDGSGEAEELYEVTGVVSEIIQDDQFVYFIDNNWCCEALDSDLTDFLLRLDKSSLEVVELQSAELIQSITLDGDTLYWAGRFDPVEGQGSFEEKPSNLYRMPRDGGDSEVIYQSPADLDGPLAAAVYVNSGMVIDGDTIWFNSLNLEVREHNGIYGIDKNANAGTPTQLVDGITLDDAFMVGSTLVTNGSRAVYAIDPSDGSANALTCEDFMSAITPMVHDDERIYYARLVGELGEQNANLRSIPMPD